MEPEDLGQYLAVISLFQKTSPDDFHFRLLDWCDRDGFEFSPDWSTNTVLQMLDDERVKKLGATLRRMLLKGLSAPVKK